MVIEIRTGNKSFPLGKKFLPNREAISVVFFISDFGYSADLVLFFETVSQGVFLFAFIVELLFSKVGFGYFYGNITVRV
jgi:hypothetical protein